jgi:uncharacterized membrane protein
VHIQGTFKVLVGVVALVALVLLLLAWSLNRTPRQEAAGQGLTVPTVTAPPASPPATSTPRRCRSRH